MDAIVVVVVVVVVNIGIYMPNIAVYSCLLRDLSRGEERIHSNRNCEHTQTGKAVTHGLAPS